TFEIGCCSCVSCCGFLSTGRESFQFWPTKVVPTSPVKLDFSTECQCSRLRSPTDLRSSFGKGFEGIREVSQYRVFYLRDGEATEGFDFRIIVDNASDIRHIAPQCDQAKVNH